MPEVVRRQALDANASARHMPCSSAPVLIIVKLPRLPVASREEQAFPDAVREHVLADVAANRV